MCANQETDSYTAKFDDCHGKHFSKECSCWLFEFSFQNFKVRKEPCFWSLVIKFVLHDISLNLIIGFTPGRDAEAASLGGLETPHGFHQTLIAPLVSSGNEAKPSRRCSRTTWSLDNFWAASPWVQLTGPALPVFLGTFWTHPRTNVAEISLFGEVARHVRITLLCTLSRVSHRELVKNAVSVTFAWDIILSIADQQPNSIPTAGKKLTQSPLDYQPVREHCRCLKGYGEKQAVKCCFGSKATSKRYDGPSLGWHQ